MNTVFLKVGILATLITISSLISTQANAFNGWMNIHLGSSHAQSQYVEKGELQEYNEKNFGIGLALPVTSKLDVLSGFYENSYNKTSVYAGVNYHSPNNYGLSVGLNSGFVTGYDDTANNDSKIAVMLVPHVTYAVKNFRAEVGFIPSLGIENRTSVVAFTVGSRF